MSTSIRPPAGSPLGPSALDGPSSVGHSESAESAGVRNAASSAPAAQAAPTSSPTGVWLARLEAGEVTRSQAIDGLVAQALEVHGAASLPAAQRAELSGLLRSALLEDPVLGRLLG